MTSMPHDDGRCATCGFCARVYFWHTSPATAAVVVGNNNDDTSPHTHSAHVHIRCCRSVRELLATLQHVRLDEHVRGVHTHSHAQPQQQQTQSNNNNSAATLPPPQSFFWIDMHGCPCADDDVPLSRVWSLLGVHAHTQHRLTRTAPDHHHHNTAADDDDEDDVQCAAHDARRRGSDSSNNSTTSTTTTTAAALQVRSMFDDHVYYEVDMDAPDTVQLLPLAGLDSNSDSNNKGNDDKGTAAVASSSSSSSSYYVAMQLAALMELHVLPAGADARSFDWMAPVSGNVSFADDHVHALTQPDNDDSNNGGGDGYSQPPPHCPAQRHQHLCRRHRDNDKQQHHDDNNARAVDLWDGDDADATRRLAARKTIITTAHVLCFAQGCLTWCPSSNMPVRIADDDEDNDNDSSNNNNAASAVNVLAANTRAGERAYQHVKDWSKLQEAVLARLRRSAHTNNNNNYNSSSNNSSNNSGSNNSNNNSNNITTTEFIMLLMSTLCYGFLPDVTAALSEVDAIDAMLPTVVPEHEAEQAAALHRIMVQRRRLSMLRRLLYRKVRLMEELDKPAMHTLAAFMSVIVPHTRTRARYAPHAVATTTTTTNAAHAPQPSSGGGRMYSTYDVMTQFVAKLDAARLTLGNLTLVYTSAVTSRNSRTSTGTDLYQLMLQYMIVTVLPLSMVASHWGMNCNVPWKDAETTTPFWSLTGFMFGLMLLMLVYPMWAYTTERYQYIM